MTPAAAALASFVPADRPRWVAGGGGLALLGATLGVALDAVHTHTGTTAYAHPVLLGMAWWVPLLFGGGAVAMGLARPLADHLLARPPSPVSAGSGATGMGLFVLAYVLSGVLPVSNAVRVPVLATVFAVAWAVCDRSLLGLVLAAATAAVGTSVEIGLVRLGAFSYTHPDLAGVAAWLPWLYATGAIGVGNLGRRLIDGAAPAA